MKTIHAKAAIASFMLLTAMASCSTPPGGIAYDQGHGKEIREIEHSWAQVAVSGDPGSSSTNLRRRLPRRRP
jgi:hypothetical protein